MASEMTIVGIGASAGGVEALQVLFEHVPVDSGMAFVVITPLARGRVSSLVEILARSTSLPVIEAQDGAEVQSDHVYVIPPDGIVTIVDHRLQVRQPDQHQLIRHPIDILLASLAEHSSERAVAIILSGSGNDMLVEAERSQKVAIARLDTRLRQQAAIAEFGAQALRTSDLDALLQQASILVAKGLEIERAKVLELAPEKDHLLVRAGIGWAPGVVGKATIGADRQSPAGHALLTGEPVVSVDFALEHRFKIPDLLQEHNIRSAINVIIRGEGEPFGVLEVDSTKVRQFEEDDINFMQSCANLVASALDRLKAEARLERALEEKQVLLHELQHRVKNNLQEMSALVALERRKVADPGARRPLEVLGSRLEALSVVYRQLYMVNHHTEVPLNGYLAELAGELFAFHGVDPAEIASELRLAEMRVNLDSALPLGLITCEFIVNSFKHAFPHGRGCISLGLEQDGPDRARLTLADDGIGLGSQGNQGSGLQLIRRLVEQIGGELQVAGEGSTTMTIAFPLRLSEPARSSRGA
jgi:two-component sensor histidine kinase